MRRNYKFDASARDKSEIHMRASIRRWLWLQIFSMLLTLFWSGIMLLIGEGPSPLLLLLGILQAVIVFNASEKERMLLLEQRDVS